MARIVSGFRKHQRNSRTWLTYLAMATTWCKRVLSRPILRLPSFRSNTRGERRPQAYLKRDIHRKRLDNPFNKEPVWSRAKAWLDGHRYPVSISALLLLLASWFFIVFVQPTFYITRVMVEGTQEIPPEEIAALAQTHLDSRDWLFIKHAHRLFMNLASLSQQIHARYDLDALTFEPSWPDHLLVISVQEKTSFFVYGVDNHYYAVDKEGSIIRELPQQIDTTALAIPVLYEYDSKQLPTIGQNIVSQSLIQSIQTLADGFKAYPNIHIHSFRLRISPQREIVLTDKAPTAIKPSTAKTQNDLQLQQAAESIAHAQTLDQKVNQLKQALQNVQVQKIEESKLDELLQEKQVFEPTDGFQYKELEIYTKEGWSIKVGHGVFDDPEQAKNILNIFATLAQKVDLKEVREYVDLRVENRVYYR